MRWIFRIIGALVALVLLAVGALFLLPTERIASVAADRISAATGRSVEITGEVSPTLWPHLGVRAGGFRIGNPAWMDGGDLISAEALSVRVPWSAALSGEIEVEEITLQSPRINLVRSADGRGNWSFETVSETAGTADPEPSPQAPSANGGMAAFALDRATISDGALLFIDMASDQRFEIDGLDAEISLPRGAPALVDVSARLNGQALSATGEVDDIAALLGGELRAMSLALDWDGGEARFSGDVSLDPSLDGDLRIDATDLAPLAAMAGQAAPALPAGAGQDRVALQSHVTLTPEGTAHLRDAALTLDQNQIALELDVTPGADRPMIRGSLRSDQLSLPESGGSADGTGQSGTASAESTGWSREPIDVSGLFAVDTELSLRVGSLAAGDLRVSDMDLRVTNTAGRAVIDVIGAGLYGGTLAGQLVVNGRGGLSVRTDLFLVGVQLSPLLDATAGYERLEGRGSASLQVLGVGNDLDTLMRSLEGQGDLALGAGAILGLDIAGMIRNLDASFQGEGARTVFDSLTANFDIAGGVLRNDDLFLDAPWGTVTGAGDVNLGGQTLDYRLVPGVMRDDQGVSEIQVPILVSGPWARPSIRLDLEYLAQQELAEQAERLEEAAQQRLAEESDRLEAEARDQINEALNLELEEGDTVEDAGDALEQRLQEEVGNQLQRLFGGN